MVRWAGFPPSPPHHPGRPSKWDPRSSDGLPNLTREGNAKMTFTLEKDLGHNGKGCFNCDTCSEVIITDGEDFKESLIEAKREGWRTYRGPDGEWAHACPSCTRDFASRKAS